MAVPRMETYVFLDFEATGLFSESRVGLQNDWNVTPEERLDRGINRGRSASDPRATELALVAVSRDSFVDAVHQQKNSMPRDLGVWVKQFNPQLTNQQWAKYNQYNYNSCNAALMEFQLRAKNTFSAEWGSLISFLSNLPTPLCLVAHNGAWFDYRLLAFEMDRAGVGHLPQQIYIIDSMCAFQHIENQYVTDIHNKIVEVNTRLLQSESEIQLVRPLRSQSERTPPKHVTNGNQSNSSPRVGCKRGRDFNVDDYKRPPLKRRLVEGQGQSSSSAPAAVQSAASAPSDSQLVPSPLTTLSPPIVYLNRTTWTPAKKKRAIKVKNYRRAADGTWNAANGSNRLMYGLASLHSDLIGSDFPDQHYAEADCKALMRVCLQFGMDFVNHLDANAWQWKYDWNI